MVVPLVAAIFAWIRHRRRVAQQRRLASPAVWRRLLGGVPARIRYDNLRSAVKRVLAGRDRQLERAIQEVIQRIKKHPKRLPDRPADPVKTK